MMDDCITISDDEDVQLIKHVVNLEPIIVDLTKNDDVSSQQATNGTSDDENKRPSPQSSPNVSNRQFCPFKSSTGSQEKSSQPTQPPPDTRPPPPPPPDHQNIFKPAPQPAPNFSKQQFCPFKSSAGSQEKPPQSPPDTNPSPPQTNHHSIFRPAPHSPDQQKQQQQRQQQPQQLHHYHQSHQQHPQPPPPQPQPSQKQQQQTHHYSQPQQHPQHPAPSPPTSQQQPQPQQQLDPQPKPQPRPQPQPQPQPQPHQQQQQQQEQEQQPQPQPQPQPQQKRLNPPSPQKQTLADLEAQKELGNQKYRNNQFDDAIRIYRGAISLAKELNHTKMSAMLHFNLAMTYYKVSSFDQAADECANAVKYDPNYLKAHLKRAEIYTRQYKFEEAVICYEYICEIESDHARLLQKAKELASSRTINKKDFYQILGLHPNFTREDLKKAYRQKALSHHPDRHSDADIVTRRIEEKRFKDASEAYSFLQQRYGYLR